MRLLQGAVTGVSIEPQIGFAEIGLRVLMRPSIDLILINQNIIAIDPSLELGQLFLIFVKRHAAVESVVPVMHTANEVLTTQKAVRHQRAPVQTATIEHRHFVIDAHDDKIDLAHQRIGRVAVFEVSEFGYGALCHRVAFLVLVGVGISAKFGLDPANCGFKNAQRQKGMSTAE